MPKKLTKKQKREVSKFALSNWKVLVVLFVLIVMFVVLAYYMGWIDLILAKFKDDEDDTPLNVAGGYTTEMDNFKDLQIAFLDIGQGDCMIIELPDGKNMIIDSGDSNSDQDVIEEYTTANNITTFDYMLLTHQDADHVHNMDWVLENYKVKYIFRPNVYSSNDYASSLPETFNPKITDENAVISTSKAYAEFLVAAYNEQCTYEIFNKDSDFQNTIKVGEETVNYSFNFLTPTAEKSNIHYNNANDYSPIVMLEYAGKRIVFNGDAEETALEEYVTTYGNQYNVDVYKVGHHGSENATTTDFLTAIDPEYAVIQCGYNNSYKHPHKVVIDRLTGHDNNIEIYRNDTNGNIVLSVSVSGEMTWDFENDDMSKNLLSGEELVALGQSLNVNRYADSFSMVVEMLSQCVYNYKKEFVI